MDGQLLSTAEVARALGVGVTTVKRWVDDNILPARKTPGGHRKLLLEDVLRLARSGALPNVDVAQLAGAKTDAGPEPFARRLTEALQSGDHDATRAVIRQAHRALGAAMLADDVVAPAMERIGHEWEAGRIDVLHEHRGTQICAGALYELKMELNGRVAAKSPVAVGGAPEGDPYLLSSLLIELALIEAGWAPISLGPNTPLASFRKALLEFRPRLVWLSVSFLADEARFITEYAELWAAAERLAIPVALGGQRASDELRRQLEYTTYCERVRHLSQFAAALQPPPRPPRRGRPRGS